MLAIYAQENDNPWPAGGGDAGRALACLEGNPFTRFREMLFDVEPPWEPYDRNRAALHLDRNRKALVGLRANDWPEGEASASRHPTRNLLQLRVADERLREPGAGAEVIRFAGELARALPRFAYGGATADLEVHDFYVARGLEFLPECFDYVGWYHLLSPLGYADYFDAEDLRTLPAHEVTELPGGWFAVKSYPDPLGFADEAVRRRIVEMTEHLNARRKDWKETGPA